MSFFDLADSVSEAFYSWFSLCRYVVPWFFAIYFVFVFIYYIVKFFFKSIKKKKNVKGE